MQFVLQGKLFPMRPLLKVFGTHTSIWDLYESLLVKAYLPRAKSHHEKRIEL